MEERIFVCRRHVGAGKAKGGESVWEGQKQRIRIEVQTGFYKAAEALDQITAATSEVL